ncbi:MAG: DUF503 domain-containing protein [Clostridiales bacterium]|jgi:uncharacterized protein YlxP (DUF503 family)|nr:DUF503 domain-containing protein [Clostridiales bacterium]
MMISVLTITLYVPWAHSLKEKRMVLKSLTTKIRGKFNVSVAETGSQDAHQSIVITIAAVAANNAQSDSIIDNVINFVETATDAQITQIERDTR